MTNTYYTTAQPLPPSKPSGPYSSPYSSPPQQPPYAAQYPSSAHLQQQYPQQAQQPPYTAQYPSSSMEKSQQQQYPHQAQQPPYTPQYPSLSTEKSQQQQYPQQAQQPPYTPQYPSPSTEKSQQQQYPQQAQQPPYAPQYPASAMEKPLPQYPQQAPPTPVYTQPQPIQTMAVGGGGNRNVKNLPVGPKGREWSHGLCDCCDEPGTCLFAWFCSCVLYSQLKKRVEHLNFKGTPDPEAGGGFFSGDCISHYCLNAWCGLGWVLQVSTRSTIRSRYNIEGDGCSDCMAAWCCTPCELTQESRELELEEASFGGQRTA